MNRRSFLHTLAAASSGLLIPDYLLKGRSMVSLAGIDPFPPNVVSFTLTGLHAGDHYAILDPLMNVLEIGGDLVDVDDSVDPASDYTVSTSLPSNLINQEITVRVLKPGFLPFETNTKLTHNTSITAIRDPNT